MKQVFIQDPYHQRKRQVKEICMDLGPRIGFPPAVIQRVEGGWLCFEGVDDHKTWRNQK